MRKRILCIALFFIFLFLSSCSAPYRTLIIISTNAPHDIEISPISGEAKSGEVRHVAWKTYYYVYLEHSVSDVTLSINGSGEKFELEVEYPPALHTTATMDFARREISQGRMPDFLSIFISVGVALLLEAFIFYAFGFRKKRSWLLYIAVVIILQCLLRLYVYNCFPDVSLLLFVLIIGTLIISPLKATVLTLFIKEHKVARRIICILFADFTSLASGSILITLLPI